MKKIINGKKYDTNTAKEIGRYVSYGSWGDFRHYEETLYQKKTGEFFLWGKGGPMTKYAVAVDTNSWSGGESIIPLTLDGAKEWCEHNLTADEYEKIFGEVEE